MTIFERDRAILSCARSIKFVEACRLSEGWDLAGCHARNRLISGSSHVVGPSDVRHTAATHLSGASGSSHDG